MEESKLGATTSRSPGLSEGVSSSSSVSSSVSVSVSVSSSSSLLFSANIILPHVWNYLTLHDIYNLRATSKSWYQHHLRRIEYNKCRDGNDYQVAFPGYPGILSTPADIEQNAGLHPHQLASLEAMYQAENSRNRNININININITSQVEFGTLRGGILGDAPGLGKTITMLALIASTAGVRPTPPPEFWNNEAIEEGWKWMRQTPSGREQILIAFKPIRTWAARQYGVTSAIYEKVQKVGSYLEPPYKDNRFPSFPSLETFVIRTLKDTVPRSELELYRQNLIDVKLSLDKGSRKILKSAKGRRVAMERRLLSTSATLIVVPDALLEHWFQQINQHVELRLFADHLEQQQQQQHSPVTTTAAVHGVVYLDGVGDLADIVNGGKALRNLSLRNVPVMHTWDLSKYLIVLTTFSRCKAEYQRDILRNSNQSRQSRKRSSGSQDRTNDPTNFNSSSNLLQLRWLRLVVDEGHELGTHEANSEVTSFINQIAAERRWVLSGTPTTGNEDLEDFTAESLDQLQRLLLFLRHSEYGIAPEQNHSTSTTTDNNNNNNKQQQPMARDQKMSLAMTSWNTNVKGPFLKRKPEGRSKLLAVLKDIMVMHRKEDIDLPKPIFRQIEQNVALPVKEESKLLAHEQPWLVVEHLNQYLHSSDFQTLVDKAQAKYIEEAIAKYRQELKHNSKDRRPIKAVVYSSHRNNLLSVTEHILRSLGDERVAQMDQLSNIGDMSSELSRFRTDCRECRICPICHQQNDVQRSAAHQCKTMLIEVVVTANSGDGVWRILIEPERIAQTLNVPLDRMGGEDLSSYSKLSKYWEVGDIIKVDIRSDHPLWPKRKSREEWIFLGSERCRELAEKDNFQGRDWFFGPLSDTTSHEEGEVLLDFVEARLVKWQTCGRFHNSRWYKGPSVAQAPLKKIREDVPILSLDAQLSHGLDLSFVTHMFLLESIEDAALLEQVTSRAHRLGATGPVAVETINVFYTSQSPRLNALVEEAGVSDEEEPEGGLKGENGSIIVQDRARTLSKVVCSHCYREFDSHAKAVSHEENSCPRNPGNKCLLDKFKLSTVYYEIRPPMPLTSSASVASSMPQSESDECRDSLRAG